MESFKSKEPVSTTISGLWGASYGLEIPVNSLIWPKRAFL